MRKARSAARAPRPRPQQPPSRLRFAFASCQQYEQGYYGAYRHMVADEPDLVLHLGDYIYEARGAATTCASTTRPRR